ncbi:ABC transporter permease [Algihabitans albus]|uniref:ABC transporter permease n=1 Tax=Algihabitans albus TaxID=2164067 RepID=UPI0035CE86A9
MPLSVRLAAGVAALLFLVGFLAPVLAPYDPAAQDLLARLQPPVFLSGSSAHLLGTDHLGRDVLSRLLYGLRTTLIIASLGVLVGIVTGGLAGLVSGLAGGRVDNAFMLLVDAQASVPLTLIALTAVALAGSSPLVLVLIVGISDYDKYARVVRAQVLVIRNRTYVESARALGASPVRLAFVHVLPNVVSPLTVLATISFSSVVILESALSFLGVGIQPPDTSLGALLGEGRDYLITAWWLAAIPTVAIIAITMAISLLGDWLRDVFDRRLSA